MAEANQKVMEMIRTELTKNPDISNDELREKAKSMDKSIDKLSARQFNATYPLQVKRQLSPGGKRGGRKGGRRAAGRRRKAGAAKGAAGGSRGRKAATTRGGGRRAGVAASAGNGNRDQVRKVLVELAREVAEGDRGALVEVGASIDRYVDRVLKAAG